MTLPIIDGLTTAQQTRLDGELTARGLTTYKAQQANIGGVVAALHAVFNVDATTVLTAYHNADQPPAVSEQVEIKRIKRGSTRGKYNYQSSDIVSTDSEV